MKLRVFVKIGRRHGPLGWDGEWLTVGISTPPIDSAANVKLIEVISAWLGVRKSMITVVQGHTTRYKTLEVITDPALCTHLVRNLPQLPARGVST